MSGLIDFHTHILPQIDDGSKSVSESMAMVSMLSEQGIKTVVASPHFYANRIDVSGFLEKRNEAYEMLSKQLPADSPEILLGAEVKYYEGISRLATLDQLCIEKSNLLLLEMPFSKWSEYEVKELLELTCITNLTVAIAHIERYMRFQSQKTLDLLRERGVIMQANSNFFTGVFTKNKALSMLLNGEIVLIGSDCHGQKYRPPNIKEAYDTIRKKTNHVFFEEYCGFIESLFE